MTRVLPDYSPLLEAVGTGKSRADWQQQQVNTSFDQRVMSEALPIRRMISVDGSINKEGIAGAGKGFTDASTLFDQMSAAMPRGRGVDPVVFNEKYQAGKQMYDMSLANQLNMMKQSGYSDKKIWKTLGQQNPELRRYAVENAILAPQLTGTSPLKTALKIGGTIGAIRGGTLLNELRQTPKPTGDQIKALNEAGYKYQKGGKSPGIKRMTTKDILKLDQEPLKEPVKKDFKYKTGKSAGKVNTRAYNKAVKEFSEENARRLASAKEIVKTTKGREASRIGKQALARGAKGTAGKAATNIALKSVGKTLGTQVGKGIGMRALGMMGGPLGLAITGAWTIMDLIKYLNRQDPSDTTSRWK